MIRAILFDFDGVLAKEELFSKRLAREYGITTDMTDCFFSTEFSSCLVGKADLKQELKRYLDQWGWQESVDEFLRFWLICDRTINETLVSAIQQLRQAGILCYLATNQERYRTEYILHQIGFNKKFDGTFSSSNVKYLKDDPKFFKHILRILDQLKAQEILFLDDSIENIFAAKQVGLHAEIYTDFHDFERLINIFFANLSLEV